MREAPLNPAKSTPIVSYLATKRYLGILNQYEFSHSIAVTLSLGDFEAWHYNIYGHYANSPDVSHARKDIDKAITDTIDTTPN